MLKVIFEESLLQARGPQLNIRLVDGPIVVFDLVLLFVGGAQLMILVSRQRVVYCVYGWMRGT